MTTLKRTVLLVDDDALVRPLLRDMLEELGFQVFDAASGAEALELLPRLPRLDALVTDVLMPGMDGRTLAEHVRKARPGLPVAYVTGFSADLPLHDACVIRKPFTARDLGLALGSLLLPLSDS